MFNGRIGSLAILPSQRRKRAKWRRETRRRMYS
jgi:hypothetical protein